MTTRTLPCRDCDAPVPQKTKPKHYCQTCQRKRDRDTMRTRRARGRTDRLVPWSPVWPGYFVKVDPAALALIDEHEIPGASRALLFAETEEQVDEIRDAIESYAAKIDPRLGYLDAEDLMRPGWLPPVSPREGIAESRLGRGEYDPDLRSPEWLPDGLQEARRDPDTSDGLPRLPGRERMPKRSEWRPWAESWAHTPEQAEAWREWLADHPDVDVSPVDEPDDDEADDDVDLSPDL